MAYHIELVTQEYPRHHYRIKTIVWNGLTNSLVLFAQIIRELVILRLHCIDLDNIVSLGRDVPLQVLLRRHEGFLSWDQRQPIRIRQSVRPTVACDGSAAHSTVRSVIASLNSDSPNSGNGTRSTCVEHRPTEAPAFLGWTGTYCGDGQPAFVDRALGRAVSVTWSSLASPKILVGYTRTVQSPSAKERGKRVRAVEDVLIIVRTSAYFYSKQVKKSRKSSFRYYGTFLIYSKLSKSTAPPKCLRFKLFWIQCWLTILTDQFD